MFLVELNPGNEVLYRSLAELSAAIRSGEVRSKAQIFHRNSGTWVSITVHPEYRKISDEHELLAVGPLSRKRWTFFDARKKGDRMAENPHSTEASHPEATPELSDVYPMVLPTEEKPGVRQLMRGAMRWLRKPKTM
jgi:hypothetical protein